MKLKYLLILMILPGFIFAQSPSKFKYVGAKKCSMCHKSKKSGAQFKLWKERKHSKSFEALKSDKGIKFAKSKGIDDPTKAKKCLTCHAPGLLVPKNLMAKSFKPEEGVQCETCHGAGEKYKKMSTMKNKAKAVKNGLIDFKSDDDIKAMCVKCHSGTEHTGKFDFAKAWEKVKHPTPKKK